MNKDIELIQLHKIITPGVTIILYDNDILHIKVQKTQIITNTDAHFSLDQLDTLLKEKLYLILIEADANAMVTPEAKAFLSSSQGSRHTKAQAFWVKDDTQNAIIETYIAVNKPMFKTKILRDKQKALKWLLKQA